MTKSLETTPFWVACGDTETKEGGICRVSPSPEGGFDAHLSINVANPTFLAAHPKLPILYAACEMSPGAVATLRVTEDNSLQLITITPSGGDGPCHVEVGRESLYISNYGDGTLAVSDLYDSGSPTSEPTLRRHSGSGPVKDRQEDSHAHSSLVVGDRSQVVVADLGTDELRGYALDDEGQPAAEPVLSDLPAGFGPRHMAQWRGKLVVAGELSGDIAVLEPREGGRWETVAVAPVLPKDEYGLDQRLLSHIAVHDDHAIVAVRGADMLVSVALDDLSIRDTVKTATWPRHFAILDDEMIAVAGQMADQVWFHHTREGEISDVLSKIEVTAPFCVLPADD